MLASVVCASSSCSYSVTSLLQLCSHCNGHGQCWQGYCQCSEGFATALTEAGVAANASSVLSVSSTNLSSAVEAALLLDDINACTLLSCPLDCNGNGVCEADTDCQHTSIHSQSRYAEQRRQ